MPLTLAQIEEISTLLLQVPLLIDGFERHGSNFHERACAWIKHAEEVLLNNRQPSVSKVASYRASLVQASRGIYSDEIHFVGRPTRQKIQDACSIMALQHCNHILHDAIAERQAVFREAERLARQLVVVAEIKGYVSSCKDFPSHQSFLESLQSKIAIDSDLASGFTHLLALVGKYDSLILLDRAIGS